jgi:hypothetical protein
MPIPDNSALPPGEDESGLLKVDEGGPLDRGSVRPLRATGVHHDLLDLDLAWLDDAEQDAAELAFGIPFDAGEILYRWPVEEDGARLGHAVAFSARCSRRRCSEIANLISALTDL